MESKRVAEPQTPQPEESLKSSQIKKISLGILCGLATTVAGWYLGVAVAATEAFHEFNKPAFGGKMGGIVAAVVGGFLGGVLMTALMTTGVPAIAGAWVGYTRGLDAVQALWKATTDTVYGFTKSLKDKVSAWTDKPRSVWNALTSYLSKVTDNITSVFTANKPNTASVTAKSIAATTTYEGLDHDQTNLVEPTQKFESKATNSSTAQLLRVDSALQSQEPGRPTQEVSLTDTRPEQVRKEEETPRASTAGLLANNKQPPVKEEEGIVAKFKNMLGL